MTTNGDAAAWLSRLLLSVLPARDLMGVEVRAADDSGVRLHYPLDPCWIGPGDIVSGPATLAMADSVIYAAAQLALGIEHVAVVADMTVRFVAPARAADIEAVARVEGQEGRRLHLTGLLSQDGRPILEIVASCAGIRPPPGFPAIEPLPDC